MAYNKLTGSQAILGGIVLGDGVTAGGVIDYGDENGYAVLDGLRFRNLAVPLTAATHGTAAKVDTTADLPADALVHNVILNVTTAETTTGVTINVGLSTAESGSSTGFLSALAITATGQYEGSLAAGAVTIGSYMKEAPSTTAAVGSVPKAYRVASSTSARSIMVETSATCASFAGTLYFVYTQPNA